MGLGSRLIGTAFLVAAGVAAVTVVVAAPTILRVARPTVRAGLKRGMELYARARSAAAEFAEDVEDLVAEVQGELVQAAAPPQPEEPPQPQPAQTTDRRAS